MNTLKKLQIILLVIALNFFFVFSSQAIDHCLDGFQDNYPEKHKWHIAAEKGQIDVMESLLNKGMDINLKDSNGKTALQTAFDKSDRETMSFLISKGADINNIFIEAVEKGDIQAARSLIILGGEVHGGIIRKTLIRVIEKGDIEMAEFVIGLKKGSIYGKFISIAIFNQAVEKGYKKIVGLIFPKLLSKEHINVRHEGKTPLERALEKNDKEMAEFLLSLGAGINLKALSGETILIRAIRRGDNKEKLEFLISLGANVNVSHRGETPLSIVIKERDIEKAEFLMDLGAELNPRAKGNQKIVETALNIAVSNGDKQMIGLLINRGADINAGNYGNGKTPLIKAIEKGEIEMVKYVISLGADINKYDFLGETPLGKAVINEREDIKSFLLTLEGIKLTTEESLIAVKENLDKEDKKNRDRENKKNRDREKSIKGDPGGVV